MISQFNIALIDVEGEEKAPINNKQDYHIIASIEGETMACAKYMQESASFAVTDANKKLSLIIKEESKELLDRLGSISFSLAEIINAIGNDKCKIWITLFDDINDDLYDGDYHESDKECPRILVEMHFSEVPESPNPLNKIEIATDSLEKKPQNQFQDKEKKDSSPQAPKIGDISSVYYTNNDKKPGEDTLIYNADEAGIRKELDDELDKQSANITDAQAYTISNEQDATTLTEIKSKISEISLILSSTTLQERYNEATSTILSLKKEIILYKEKISKHESDLKVIPSLNEQVNTLRKQILQMEQIIEKYKQSEYDKNSVIKANSVEITKLEKDLLTLKNANNQALEEYKYKYQTTIKDVEQSLSDNQSQLRLKNAMLEEKTSESNNYKQKLKSIEEEYAKMKSLNSELNKRLELSEQSMATIKQQYDSNLIDIEKQAALIKKQYEANSDGMQDSISTLNKERQNDRQEMKEKEEQYQASYKELNAKYIKLNNTSEEQRQTLERKVDDLKTKADKISAEKESYALTMENHLQQLKLKLSQENINRSIQKNTEGIIELLNKLLEGKEAYLLIIKETQEKNSKLQANISQLMAKCSNESDKNRKLEEDIKSLHDKMQTEKQQYVKESDTKHREIERLNEVLIKTKNRFEEFEIKIKEADAIHQKSKEKDEIISTLRKKLEEYEKTLQKHMANYGELAKENEILKGQVLFRDEKLKIYEKESNDKEKALYIPEATDKVDQMLAYYINQAQCPIKISKVGDGHYMFGTKKIFAKILNDRLVIRVGGGFMMVDEFLSIYTAQELAKIEKEEHGRNNNGSLSAQKSEEYSGRTSPMAIPDKEKGKRVPIRSRSPIGSINGTNRTKQLNETELKNIKQLAAPKSRIIEKSINTKGSITSITTKRIEEVKDN